MSLFAALWCAWAISGSSSAPVFYAVPLVVSASIIFVAANRHELAPPISVNEQNRIARLGGLISGVEGVLIVTAFLVLANTGGMALAAPIVAIIVGLHFIPLGRLLSIGRYLVTGLLLAAIGICGFLIPNLDQRILCVCIGAAAVLWLTCLSLLGRRPGIV